MLLICSQLRGKSLVFDSHNILDQLLEGHASLCVDDTAGSTIFLDKPVLKVDDVSEASRIVLGLSLEAQQVMGAICAEIL